LYDRNNTVSQATAITSTAGGHSWTGFVGTTANNLLGIVVGWGRATPEPMPVFLEGQQATYAAVGGSNVRQIYKGATQIWTEISI